MSDTGVAAGISFRLVIVGVLAISMAYHDILDVAELLQVDYEAAAELWFDQCLVGGSWVALTFFCFSMTTGFNLLQLQI